MIDGSIPLPMSPHPREWWGTATVGDCHGRPPPLKESRPGIELLMTCDHQRDDRRMF